MKIAIVVYIAIGMLIALVVYIDHRRSDLPFKRAKDSFEFYSTLFWGILLWPALVSYFIEGFNKARRRK